MRRLVWLIAFLAACAPTTGGLFGEADLAGVLPGAGTYRGPEPVPTVGEDLLAHPDPRIREEAFARLRSEKRNAEAYGSGAGPEFHYLYGVYYAASGQWDVAISYYNLGLKALYPYAFDRQGRDIWLYGYGRARAYLQREPAKALRDARILLQHAAPPVTGRMPQEILARELLVEAYVRTGGYEQALKAADEYFRAWKELVGTMPYVGGWYSFWRVVFQKGKALEALGRREEARQTYASILAQEKEAKTPVEREVLRKAEERLNALGGSFGVQGPQSGPPPPQASQPQPQPKASDEPVRKNPSEVATEEAQKAVQGLVEALKAVDLVKADNYLAIPRFDRSLVERISPEARAKAATFRFEVGRVVLPSAVQAYITVELTYDFGTGPKTIRLPLLSGEAGQGLKIRATPVTKVLNGTPSVIMGALLGLGDLPEKVNAFLDEYLRALGL
ncbi:hypothetical protein [Thermus albus]|uniref:hypothetical protein n=1 Tax=Thermus albus TaxID=2908146 RepID=UPI001FA97F0E|nr:hypothetical protein [Thermus albus]